ncbi:MAG: sugar transferase [Gemmatimonadota bacterium]
MIGTAKVQESEPALRRGPVRFDLRPQRDACTRRLWRERTRRVLRVSSLIGGELVGGAVALFLALAISGGWTRASAVWPVLYPLFMLLAMGGQAALHTYGPNRARRSYTRAILGAGLAVIGLLLAGLAYPEFRLSADEYALLAVAAGVFFAGVRMLVERVIREIYRRGIGRKPTLIIGEHEAAWEILVHLIASEERRVQVVGHLAPEPVNDPTALGGLDMLGELIERHDIRSVIVSAHLEASRFQEVVRRCLTHGTSVSVVPATLSELPCRFASHELLGWPLIELEVPRLHLLQVALKRTVDIMVSLAGILLLSPLWILIALAVRLDSPGPILFRQRRLGLSGRPFTIYKFRSMRADAEARLKADSRLYRRYVENHFKLPPEEDPRITRLGAFLRKTSLDEIPQLLNVLLGGMSLVGPRPIVPKEIKNYGDEATVFLAVRPGLTGYWQINGRSGVGYPERAELDIDYIKNWSLGTDLKILLQTVPAVLRKQGAH